MKGYSQWSCVSPVELRPVGTARPGESSAEPAPEVQEDALLDLHRAHLLLLLSLAHLPLRPRHGHLGPEETDRVEAVECLVSA